MFENMAYQRKRVPVRMNTFISEMLLDSGEYPKRETKQRRRLGKHIRKLTMDKAISFA